MAGNSKRSSMFVGSLVAAISATALLLLLYVVQVGSKPPPPVGSQAANNGPPGPAILAPPSLSAAITIVAAIAAVAWVATIAAMARDQILREMNRILAEYAEMRETDGFLSGMRQASRPEAEVRQLHPVPPID